MFRTYIFQEGGGEAANGGLAKAIDTQFGSLNALIVKMNAVGAALQGSGWVVRYLELHLSLCIISLKFALKMSSTLH